MSVTVALRLQPDSEEPTLDDLKPGSPGTGPPVVHRAQALSPLGALYRGTVDADSAWPLW